MVDSHQPSHPTATKEMFHEGLSPYGQEAHRMSSNYEPPQLGRFEYGIIKRKARQIIGRAGYSAQDQKDLEQELLVRLIQALKSFDPSRSHVKSFVTTVVERDVASILRDAQAAKRDHNRIGSINVTINVTGESPIELAQTIGESEYNSRRNCEPRTNEELAQLATDVAGVMESLPSQQRDLAEGLKARSLSEYARDCGVPRPTLSGRVPYLRQRFENAALREYL